MSVIICPTVSLSLQVSLFRFDRAGRDTAAVEIHSPLALEEQEQPNSLPQNCLVLALLLVPFSSSSRPAKGHNVISSSCALSASNDCSLQARSLKLRLQTNFCGCFMLLLAICAYSIIDACAIPLSQCYGFARTLLCQDSLCFPEIMCQSF